jgi:hypothetical protein
VASVLALRSGPAAMAAAPNVPKNSEDEAGHSSPINVPATTDVFVRSVKARWTLN